MSKADRAVRSARSSDGAIFRHQIKMLSNNDELYNAKWLNSITTYGKDCIRNQSLYTYDSDSRVDSLIERG